MKQTTFIALLLSFFGLISSSKAQNNTTQSNDEIVKRRLEYSMSNVHRSMATPVEVSVQDNKYNHREKEILEKLNTDAIPENFPVYKAEYTNDQYNLLMDKWYSQNPALLKKETNTNQPK